MARSESESGSGRGFGRSVSGDLQVEEYLERTFLEGRSFNEEAKRIIRALSGGLTVEEKGSPATGSPAESLSPQQQAAFVFSASSTPHTSGVKRRSRTTTTTPNKRRERDNDESDEAPEWAVEDMARAEGGGWFVGALHALLLILALAAMVALWWRHLSHVDPWTAAPSAWDALHPQVKASSLRSMAAEGREGLCSHLASRLEEVDRDAVAAAVARGRTAVTDALASDAFIALLVLYGLLQLVRFKAAGEGAAVGILALVRDALALAAAAYVFHVTHAMTALQRGDTLVS